MHKKSEDKFYTFCIMRKFKFVLDNKSFRQQNSDMNFSLRYDRVLKKGLETTFMHCIVTCVSSL